VELSASRRFIGAGRGKQPSCQTQRALHFTEFEEVHDEVGEQLGEVSQGDGITEPFNRPVGELLTVLAAQQSPDLQLQLAHSGVIRVGNRYGYAMVLKYAHLCPDKLAEAANLVTRKGHANRKKHAARR